MISNQDPEGGTSNIVVVKWSDKLEGSGDNIDPHLYGGLYKKEDGYLAPWSELDTYTNINCFTWSKEDSYWIVLEYQYDEEFNNW